MTTPLRFAKGDTVRHPRRPEWGIGTVRDLRAVAQPDGTRAQRLTVDFANEGRKMINTAVAPLEPAGTAPRPVPPKPKALRNTPDMPLPSHTHQRSANRPNASGDSDAGGTAVGATVLGTLAESAARVAEPVAGGRKPARREDHGGERGWLDDLDGSNRASELWDLPDALSDPFASVGDRLRATLATYRYSTEPKALIDWAIAQTGLNDPLSKYTRPELEQAFPRYARDRDQHLRDLVRQCKRASDFATLKDVGRGLFSAAQSALDKAIRS